MNKITASEVNKLRKHTGAGMMDCKNALVDSNGDFDLAIEILRKKGQKVAAKRADRESSEGVAIALSNDENTSAIGIVLAHAELSQEGKTYYTGLRYYDTYQKQDENWVFQERLLKFLFFMPMEELVRDGLTQTNRKRFPGQGELPTDLPEMQESWIKFLTEE